MVFKKNVKDIPSVKRSSRHLIKNFINDDDIESNDDDIESIDDDIESIERVESELSKKIDNCTHPENIKKLCSKLLREYNDDRENNSTSLSALELILKLPTAAIINTISTESNHSDILDYIHKAQKFMDSQIYGQNHAKLEIIEYIVEGLFNKGRPRILGLVGPPGVGKTTLALNGISKVSGLPFYQVNIGGLRDVTYLSGSLRCWKGAHHGKFAEILISAGCINPIIFIDELDKVAVETSQDIYGLLTHVTDPNTNSSIIDHYLGIDIDLSNVTFIFSYNNPEAIPSPLRDRIREIYFDTFDHNDKIHIAKDYIIPSILTRYDLNNNQLLFTEELILYANNIISVDQSDRSGIRYLINGYNKLINKLVVGLVLDQSGFASLSKSKSKSKSKSNSNSNSKYKHENAYPYYRPIKLPYVVKKDDIDHYMVL